MPRNYILTKDQKAEACRRYESGERVVEVAQSYGVKPQAITKILQVRGVELRGAATCPPKEGWITAREAATILGVTRGSVTGLTTRGKLTVCWPTDRPALTNELVYYQRTDVERLAMEREEARRYTPPGDPQRDDLLYLAGLFDGEGTVTIRTPNESRSVSSYGLFMSLANTHRGVVEWVRELCGGQMYGRRFDSDLGHMPIYCWIISGPRAATLLGMLLPFLRVKARQAELAIEFQERIEAYKGHRWRPISEEELAWRAERQALISSLNTRQGRRRKEVSPHGTATSDLARSAIS